MCCMCKKCTKVSGILILLAGIGFLLKDMGTWDFMGLSWYTVLFILVGVVKLATSKCGDCGCSPSGKKK